MSDLADPIEAAGCAAVPATAVELGLVESLSDPAPGRVHPRAEVERWCREAGLCEGSQCR